MFLLFKVISLIYLLFSSNFWLGLLLPSTPVIILINVVMGLYIISSKSVRIRITKRSLMLIASLMAITLWYSIISGVIYGIVMLLSYLPAVYLYFLPYRSKINLLYFITKWLSILLIASIGVFISTLIVNYPPPLAIFYMEDLNYDPFLNYGLFLKSTADFGIVPRFNAFFLEPGHLSIISAFLIIANKFDFRGNKYCFVLLLSVIMSFSLAGYVLLGISYVMFSVKNIRTLFGIALMGGIIFIGTQLWNNGDNVVNELIFSRLQYDENKGVSGNNRTTPETDALFDSMVYSGEIVKGIDNKEDIRIRGAGYKVFLIRYGIITTILVFIFYLCLIPKNVNRKYAFIFITMILLCFLQRAYPWWFSWLLPFTLGTGTVCRKIKRKGYQHKDKIFTLKSSQGRVAPSAAIDRQLLFR